MSADRWTKCPKCTAKKNDALESVRKLYGKISAEAYTQKLQEAAASAMSEHNRETLAEYYEVGVYGDRFRVDYGAACDKCGWTKSFKHEEKVP